jgi:hypothetical protein
MPRLSSQGLDLYGVRKSKSKMSINLTCDKCRQPFHKDTETVIEFSTIDQWSISAPVVVCLNCYDRLREWLSK